MLIDTKISTDGGEVQSVEKATITKTELSSDEKRWEFIAEFQNDIQLVDTGRLRIVLANSSENYKTRVPLSALYQKAMGNLLFRHCKKSKDFFRRKQP